MSRTTSSITTQAGTGSARYSDDAARRHAVEHVVAALGLDAEPCVTWDREHQLQGHFDVSGVHLVLIAPRRADHSPRLLTEAEWDGLRHGPLAA
jgi:hypothetical protein